jgi:hypothetical protein
MSGELTAMAASPTANAQRLTDPCRASPAAKTRLPLTPELFEER